MSLAVVRNLAPEVFDDRLDAPRDAGRSLQFARGETIFEESDPAYHLYRVVRGTVRLCRHAAGVRHIADFALPGDLFGAGASQPFAAEAVTDAALIVYPHAHFSGRLVMAQFSAAPSGHSATARFAAFILRHAERTGAIETGLLDLAMSRQDIADHIGATVETICRIVMSLRNEKVLGLAGAHQLILRNVEALCELADGALH